MKHLSQSIIVSLLRVIKTNDQEDVVLDPQIDDMTLDIVYDRIADYMVRLPELDFNNIGSIAEDLTSKTRSVTKRPQTTS